MRSGLVTACRSEPYLTFVFAFDCGPCQHQAFEDGWRYNLRLAESILGKLKQKSLPGVRKVEALVEQLNEDFNSASWNTRTLYPHAHRERTLRPSLGQFHKTPSPLSKEVLPEDIPEPVRVVGPDHPNYEYDWNYVASTNPVHPVDTNYAHPLDEVDPSSMIGHLSPEEYDQSGEGVGFDASETNTVWGSSLEEINAQPTKWAEDSTAWAYDDIAPEESLGATALESPIKPCIDDEDLLSERVDMVIQVFYSVVDEIPASNQTSQTVRPVRRGDLEDVFQSLYISSIHADAKTPKIGLLTPPPTPPRLSTDGSLDFDASTVTSPSPAVDSSSLLQSKIGPQSSFTVTIRSSVSAKSFKQLLRPAASVPHLHEKR